MERNSLSKSMHDVSSIFNPQFLGYQLIGGTISVQLWLADNISLMKNFIPVKSGNNYCNTYLDARDLLINCRKKQPPEAVGSKVILSVGYQESRNINSFRLDHFIENLKGLVQFLRENGCKEIIVTNVPPCLGASRRIEHWKILALLNNAIKEFCDDSEDLVPCNIFQLFCSPRNFKRRKEYVIDNCCNYDVNHNLYNFSSLYNPMKRDLISFSSAGKLVLMEHLRKTVKYQWSKRISCFQNSNIKPHDEESEKLEETTPVTKANVLSNSETATSILVSENNVNTQSELSGLAVSSILAPKANVNSIMNYTIPQPQHPCISSLGSYPTSHIPGANIVTGLNFHLAFPLLDRSRSNSDLLRASEINKVNNIPDFSESNESALVDTSLIALKNSHSEPPKSVKQNSPDLVKSVISPYQSERAMKVSDHLQTSTTSSYCSYKTHSFLKSADENSLPAKKLKTTLLVKDLSKYGPNSMARNIFNLQKTLNKNKTMRLSTPIIDLTVNSDVKKQQRNNYKSLKSCTKVKRHKTPRMYDHPKFLAHKFVCSCKRCRLGHRQLLHRLCKLVYLTKKHL